MYCKFSVSIFLVLVVAGYSAVCSAQKPKVYDPKITTPGTTVTATPSERTDLRPVLAKMRTENKLVRGKNLVLDAKAQGNMPAFKLWATVAEGKVTKWQAVDANGKNFLTHTNRTAAGVKVVCKVCIETPITKECYEVACDDLPKPKPLSRTAIQ